MPTRYYFSEPQRISRYVNRWDLAALLLIFAVLFVLAWGARQMSAPYEIGKPIAISLSAHNLPGYALRTVFRMGIALCISLLFTFIFGTWAAKSRTAERILVPLIDIFQSIPVLGFQAIAVVPFIMLFSGSMLGPECASIFAIFTAQAWNMVLGFYQTVKSVPHDWKEVAAMYHLNAWQRFWRIEVPFSMQGLLWNTMMSMSAGWFFVVATEAISVSNQVITLPGIGSYIYTAIQQANLMAVGYAILTMLVVITLYDQLLFRPLLMWSEKFSATDMTEETTTYSWFLDLLQRTRLLKIVAEWFGRQMDAFIGLSFRRGRKPVIKKINLAPQKIKQSLFAISFTLILSLVIWALVKFIWQAIGWHEIEKVFGLGAVTASRVILLIMISSVIWIPIGVWIGMRPRVAQIAQPIVQFLAAFPANLFFPFVVILIVHYQLNVNIWTTPLMILGSQWYIVFNVIAGARSIPKELSLAVSNYRVRGWQWWRKLALPGIFPYFVTGAITAAGGAWNASIVAEVVNWGNTDLQATGLGAYIATQTTAGDFPRIALGLVVMCLYVLLFNRVLWRPLYRYAEERFTLA